MKCVDWNIVRILIICSTTASITCSVIIIVSCFEFYTDCYIDFYIELVA